MTQEKEIQEAKSLKEFMLEEAINFGVQITLTKKEIEVLDTAVSKFIEHKLSSASSWEKGDKKFSLKDMEECFNKSRQVQVGFNDYINSLTPKEHSEGESREVEIDFGGYLKAKLLIGDKISVVAAMNGAGDGVPLSDIRITQK